ncbi:MAG: spore coat protein [Limnochordia bacterium]|nr:spore coat protein [Limnochordia bacterium]
MNNNRGSYGSYQQGYGGSSSPTIKNPSTQFEKGPEFNDRDRLNDLLATEKWLTDGFNVFVRETSHQDLYNDVLHILNETHHACRDVFNLMFEKGWYSVHPEQPSHIADHYQKYSGHQNQFPSQSTSSYNQYQTGVGQHPRDY